MSDPTLENQDLKNNQSLKNKNPVTRPVKFIRRHSERIYRLGFVEDGLKSLIALYEQQENLQFRSNAARELALLYANKVDLSFDHPDNNADTPLEIAHKCLELWNEVNPGKDLELMKEKTVLQAESLHILDQVKTAKQKTIQGLSMHPHDDFFLAAANLEASFLARIMWVNKAFRHHGYTQIAYDFSSEDVLLEGLQSAADGSNDDDSKGNSIENPAADHHKVSVIVPVISSFQQENGLRTSLNTVLNQTWQNLEVIVVIETEKDADIYNESMASFLDTYITSDERIKLVRTDPNQGSYIARNQALEFATGEFVTVHELEEWAHPEKIEYQVQHLIQHPDAVGNTSQQAIVDDNLMSYRQGHTTLYCNSNRTSLLFRREQVINNIGYWDCVRFCADLEFISRMKKAFGPEKVFDLSSGVMTFRRKNQHLYTDHEAFGYRGGYDMGARKEYLESAEYFHSHAERESLHYPFPQTSRPFPTPQPLLIAHNKALQKQQKFDVIIASDFRLPGGTTSSNVEEIKAQKQLGLRTGLIQMSRFKFGPEKTINPKIRELIDDDLVEMIVYGQKVTCEALVVKYPPVLQHRQEYIPEVHAGKIFVIMNQTPYKEYDIKEEPEYEIETCLKHCQQYFSHSGTWYAIGPSVQKTLEIHHAQELSLINLAEELWSEIIDLEEWRRPSRPERSPIPIIGRHSRDHYMKWPDQRDELLAVYPDKDYEVHILGGAQAPEKTLGKLPENWHVWAFGEMHPQPFLSKLDVFVYFTHPEQVEAFGRVIIEAMAVGVPVIIPHSYRALFGDAGLYAEPFEVRQQIDRLMNDDELYEAQVIKARDYVDKHFGYAKQAARIGFSR